MLIYINKSYVSVIFIRADNSVNSVFRRSSYD